ncbi:MAG: hypothetical protein M3Q05_01420, partial [Bacteroidota bacterium]|nr:hypothetical protein [Bacteroidota bacterium]
HTKYKRFLFGSFSSLQAEVLMRFDKSLFASWQAGLVWLFRAGKSSFLLRRNASCLGTESLKDLNSQTGVFSSNPCFLASSFKKKLGHNDIF